MIFSRAFYHQYVNSDVDTLVDSAPTVFTVADKSPKLLPEGMQVITRSIATTTSYSVPLPAGYASTSLLQVIVRTNGVLKATIVSPDHANSVSLIYGTSSEAGHYSVVDTVTSLTLYNPTASSVIAEIFLVVLPDLTDPASYLDGEIATGVQA